MSSKTITQNDLTNILNEIFPATSDDMTPAQIEDFVQSLNAVATSSVDYIVEQGQDGMWTYRKWNSGIAECWGYDSRSWSITETYGQLFFAGIPANTFIFPSGFFNSAPMLTCSRAQKEDAPGLAFPSIIDVTATTFRGYVADSTSGTKTIGLTFYARGTWK